MTRNDDVWPASDWLAEFTTDPVMRNEMTIELGAVYDYNEAGVRRPDLDAVIRAVLATVAADIRDRAQDQSECGKVDDCTTKAIVLRHLADMLDPPQGPRPTACGDRVSLGSYEVTCAEQTGHGGNHRSFLGSEWGPETAFLSRDEYADVERRGEEAP